MTKKISTKTNKPSNTDFSQQRLRAYPENVKPLYMYIGWIILGIIMIPIGKGLLNSAHDIYENHITYDNGDSSSSCYITDNNQGKTCTVEFNFDQDVDGPVYLYYEIKNYFQNHRRYYQSLSISQLQGEVLSESDVDLDCQPLYKNGSLLLNPCGLIANSYFNDVFSINNVLSNSSYSTLILNETDITITSDRENRFKQPHGFKYSKISSISENCSTVGLPDDCKFYLDKSTQTMYLYYYPEDETTQYLYETYPDQISPITGVTDEHFINWMRVEILPTFRKLYGVIHANFKKGDKLAIDITNNFEVESFSAEKALVLSTIGDFGGKNTFTGTAYITVGSFSLILGVFLFVKAKVFAESKIFAERKE